MRIASFNWLFACSPAIAALCGVVAVHAAEPAEVWEGRPYRIRAILAIEASGDLAERLAAQLPEYLHDRVNTSIGIVWRLKIEVASGPLRQRMLRGLDTLAAEDVAGAPLDEDKRLFISVRDTPTGYELSAREFDRYVDRWGAIIDRTCRQLDALPEQLFVLVRQAVAPLAHLRPDPNDPQLVLFEFRGSDLPQSGPDFTWTETGDLLQPILRRTTRDGLLLPEGANDVPWTYLEVVPPPAGAPDQEQPEWVEAAKAGQVYGQIRSAAQRPLGVRRGRTEQVAVGVQTDAGTTVVRLQSRTDSAKPLVGYELYAQNVGEKPLRLVGLSDEAGQVTVTPDKTPVQMLFVKSGGVFLARLPLVPGSVSRIAVPLPDDDVRLRVAARLASFREDMVDLVARRNIYMARVRQAITERNFDQARALLESLDELPGRTQFNQTLDREAQMYRTDDLQVQRRIDQLFSRTRVALGKFLDPRPISELHEELRQAEGVGKQVRNSEDGPASP